MITSESSNREFRRFFNEHRNELVKRLTGLLMSKHRRTILSLLKRGAEVPPIWGMLKLPEEATLYMLPIGIKLAKGGFQTTSLACFMIMKDLREQKPIMVTDSIPHAIVYSTHTVIRYKERMGLAPETEFLDICKQMFLNGCCRPKIFGDMSKIYGSNKNHRQVNFISVDGAYMGYVDGDTEVLHAETFLSPNELRQDQLYLDASKSEDLILWKAVREAYSKGEINWSELKLQSLGFSDDIAISEGRLVKLTPEEAKLRNAENKKSIEDPEYIARSIENNKKKFHDKIKRKGYQ